MPALLAELSTNGRREGRGHRDECCWSMHSRLAGGGWARGLVFDASNGWGRGHRFVVQEFPGVLEMGRCHGGGTRIGWEWGLRANRWAGRWKE